MNSENHNTKRLAKNTLALYVRMGVSMVIGLFTSREILHVLGVDDFGIYNVVGGVVAMFAILTNSLSSSVSRYLTFELGRNNQKELNTVFCTSVNVLVAISLFFVIVIEIVGVWFFNYYLNIPEPRMEAANWVMQCAILTFVNGLLAVPYNASIIAHERMGVYAYIGIWDAVAKLLIVLSLYVSPFDKLKTYAVLVLGVSMITATVYRVYCGKHFQECRYRFIWDRTITKKITSFAGWALFGDGAWILNSQGITILINLYFGVALNAARGIASTVDNIVQNFVRSFMTAVNPQITKNYASGDYEYMHRLVVMGTKYSYFIMLLLVIPIELETKKLLSIWLKEVPDYAVIFTQFSLLSTLCVILGNTLSTSISATGDIRRYQIVMGGLTLLNFPLTWLAFKLGADVVVAYIIYFCIYFSMIFVRFFIVKNRIFMSTKFFFQEVIWKVLLVTVLSLIIPGFIRFYMPDSTLRLLLVGIVSVPITLFFVYKIGMNVSERNFLIGIIKNRLPKSIAQRFFSS